MIDVISYANAYLIHPCVARLPEAVDVDLHRGDLMRTPRFRTSLLVLAAAATFAAGCGSNGSESSTQEPVDGERVRVVDSAFEPANLDVEVGETVSWVWEGRAPHDVVGDGFDSGTQREGTFSHTFDEPGTYDYECTLHPGMEGTITVVEP